MAELTNKLHLKSGSTVTDVTCYTTTDEATPVTVTGGSYWEIKNNNTVCYVGLVPVSEAGQTGKDTALKVKKSGTEYYVQTEVVNTYTVTITQSANQTITVTIDGTAHTATFTAVAGAPYTASVTPSTGYTAGSLSVSASGYVNSNMTVTATAATKKTFLVTITQTANQTITVTCAGTAYTGNFTANYGDTFTVKVTPSSGYNAGTPSVSSGTITGAITITATAATPATSTVTLTAVSNGYWQLNGANKNAGNYTVNNGTSVKVECFANDGYVKPTELTLTQTS